MRPWKRRIVWSRGLEVQNGLREIYGIIINIDCIEKTSRQKTGLFYRRGKSILYDKNPPGGSHCGGRAGCRRSDPPQAENLASGILS